VTEDVAVGARVAYLVRSFPRLSQTFVLDELLGLEALGVDLALYSMVDPREPLVQGRRAELRAAPRYLDRVGPAARLRSHLRLALRSPGRYVRALRWVHRQRDADEGYRTRSRLGCFADAGVVAEGLRREGATHLHAHFAHDPALVACLVHRLTGIPFSFTAHARDLYQVRPSALRARAADAVAVVTCCQANVEHLRRILPAPAFAAKVVLVRHGVDIDVFRPGRRLGDDGAARRPLQLVAVGRLVEKKGFGDLLAACVLLKEEGVRLSLAIYGEGPLGPELESAVGALGLSGDVHLAGARTREELLPALQQADVFVLTPRVADDGDRDGIPNVLVEAMAVGLPVVTTSAGGVPELVVDGRNGVMAPPGDPVAIADRLRALVDDERRRAQLGRAARQTVLDGFDAREAARRLTTVFLGTGPARPEKRQEAVAC
jgi:glycosyltransferase involved in cell wall biosynthesis